MKKILIVFGWLAFLWFISPARAQVYNPQIAYVTSAPSGACNAHGIDLLTPNGTLYTCQSGMWAAVSGGGGSVSLTGGTGISVSPNPITGTGVITNTSPGAPPAGSTGDVQLDGTGGMFAVSPNTYPAGFKAVSATIAQPAAPTVTCTLGCAGGATTWKYSILGSSCDINTSICGFSTASVGTQITNGPSTLDLTHTITIGIPAVSGATFCYIWRWPAGGGSPSGSFQPGILQDPTGTTYQNVPCNSSFTDNGMIGDLRTALDAHLYEPPAFDSTSFIFYNGCALAANVEGQASGWLFGCSANQNGGNNDLNSAPPFGQNLNIQGTTLYWSGGVDITSFFVAIWTPSGTLDSGFRVVDNSALSSSGVTYFGSDIDQFYATLYGALNGEPHFNLPLRGVFGMGGANTTVAPTVGISAHLVSAGSVEINNGINSQNMGGALAPLFLSTITMTGSSFSFDGKTCTIVAGAIACL